MLSSSSTGAPHTSTSEPVSHAGGHPLLSILPLVNGRSIATSSTPIAFGPVVLFGTALRAGGAPPLYPACLPLAHRLLGTSQRELRPLRTSPGLFGAANAF